MNAVAQCAADQVETLQNEIAKFIDAASRRAEVDGARRRRHRMRYHRSWPLAVYDIEQATGACFTAALHNASTQGIAFLTKRRFDLDSTVLIRLFWHDDQSPQVPAVIRHVTPTREGYLVGCEFDPHWPLRVEAGIEDAVTAD